MSIAQGVQDKNVWCRNLRRERERLGLNQEDVADSAGVTTKTVGRWEAGTPIPADKLAALAGLGFDPGFVLTGERTGAVSYLSRDEEWLLKMWSGMNERQREGWRLLLNECNAVKEPTGTIHDNPADPYLTPGDPQD